MTRPVISAALLLSMLVAAISCSSGQGKQGYTPLTVVAEAVKTSFARKALARGKAMPSITTVRFTVSGPGMDTDTRSVPVTPPQTVAEMFYVENGKQRVVAIEALDAGGNIIFQGSSLPTDMDGLPVTLSITLKASVFTLTIASVWKDEAMAMVKDGNGDLIVVGHTFGDLGGPNADPSHATPDVFVTKLTPSGSTMTPLWTVQTGTTGYDLAYAAATDGAGNIYLTGVTDGQLPGASKVGGMDAFVTKLSPTGLRLWTAQTGTAGASTVGQGIAVDGAGNAFITGYVTVGLDYDVIVVKYDPAGAELWRDQQGTAEPDHGAALSLDSGGNPFVAGYSYGDFGGNTNSGPNTTADIFLMHYLTAGGAPQWMRLYGSSDLELVSGIAVDGLNNVCVSGATYGSFLGGTNADLTGTTADAFLLKTNATGTQQWTVFLGGGGNDSANSVTFGPAGSVLVTGQISNPAPAGGYDADIFVMKYDAGTGAADPLWPAGASQFGTTVADEGRGMVERSGSVYVIGSSQGVFSPAISKDIVLLEFDVTTGAKK